MTTTCIGSHTTRVFALRDQTPMGYGCAERLLSCKKLIPSKGCRSITQVAYDHGFTTSHFNRAFRKAFGCQPSSIH
ncbi:helix-turn-helix domain-containing protein [Pseudomonas tolaasii]